jgi:hypothetical protein
MGTGVFIGIDVAQATLDVAIRPSGERWQVANDARGSPSWCHDCRH